MNRSGSWTTGPWRRQARLALALLFAALAVPAPADDFERARGTIGILPLPELFGSVPCAPYTPKEIELFRSPDAASFMGRIFVSSPQLDSPAGGCIPPEASASIDSTAQARWKLPILEFSYENPGAIVLRREGNWFEIALGNGNAWVRVQDDARYLPVEKLLADSLAYLRLQGRPVLVRNPGGKDAVWWPGKRLADEQPVEVLAFRRLHGRLWLQLRFLQQDPCSDQYTGLPAVTGWLPFHDAGGMPAVWFRSRGC